MAPYFYVLWHGGFPLMLALAWGPWPHRWTRATPTRARSLTACGFVGGIALLALALVAVMLAAATRLPALIVGVDSSRMTSLTAPVVVPLVIVSLAITVFGTRGRSGPERWAAVVVLVCLCDLVLTYTSQARFSTGWYAGRTLTVVAGGVVLMAMQKSFRELKAQAERHAAVDILTGLFNRREAHARLPEMAARAWQHDTALGVVCFDLDLFKTINDQHGHETGDRVLSEVGRVLSDCSRRYDLPARMGGEEFMLVLDDADAAATAAVAERLRLLISQIQIPGRNRVNTSLPDGPVPASTHLVPA